jgi:hypothetical protein
MRPAVADTVDRDVGLSVDTNPIAQGNKQLDQKHNMRELLQESSRDSPTAAEGEDGAASPTAQPLQKRRRVARACDECRRKKIKCDGKQPCAHCTAYSFGLLST